MTLGAISQLHADPQMKGKARAEIRRQLGGGVAFPHIDLEFLQALRDR